ncbi:MAG: CAP domain-containing protein [Verrucomicrobiales bacterium]
MKEREAAAAEDALKISGDDRAVLRENERLKAEIQPEEYAGILELNRWRIAMGLNAVRIDTKLCEASRDHSKDMNERGFFAHDSPVPGKENPWKRAKLAGTTAGAENIYSGGSDSHGANMGWFYSPVTTKTCSADTGASAWATTEEVDPDVRRVADRRAIRNLVG